MGVYIESMEPDISNTPNSSASEVSTSLRIDSIVYRDAKIHALRRNQLVRDYIADALRSFNAANELAHRQAEPVQNAA